MINPYPNHVATSVPYNPNKYPLKMMTTFFVLFACLVAFALSANALSVAMQSNVNPSATTLSFKFTTTGFIPTSSETIVMYPESALANTWHIDNTTACQTGWSTATNTTYINLHVTPQTDDPAKAQWFEMQCTGSNFIANTNPTGNFTVTNIIYNMQDGATIPIPTHHITPLYPITPSLHQDNQEPQFLTSLDLTAEQMVTGPTANYPFLQGKLSFEVSLQDLPPNDVFLRLENYPFVTNCAYNARFDAKEYFDENTAKILTPLLITSRQLQTPRVTTRYVEQVIAINGTTWDVSEKKDAAILEQFGYNFLFTHSLHLEHLPQFIDLSLQYANIAQYQKWRYNTTLIFQCDAVLPPNEQMDPTKLPNEQKYRLFFTKTRSFADEIAPYEQWSAPFTLEPITTPTEYHTGGANGAIRKISLETQLTGVGTQVVCKLYGDTTTCYLQFKLYDALNATTQLELQNRDQLWVSLNDLNFLQNVYSCDLRTQTGGVVSIPIEFPQKPADPSVKSSRTMKLTFPQAITLDSTRYTFIQCTTTLSTIHPQQQIPLGNAIIIRPAAGGKQVVLGASMTRMVHELTPPSVQKSLAVSVQVERPAYIHPNATGLVTHAFQFDGPFIAQEVLKIVKDELKQKAAFTSYMLSRVATTHLNYTTSTGGATEADKHLLTITVVYLAVPRDVDSLIRIFHRPADNNRTPAAQRIVEKLTRLYVSSSTDVVVTATTGGFAYSAVNKAIDYLETDLDCGGRDSTTPRCPDTKKCQVDDDCEKFCSSTLPFKLVDATEKNAALFVRKRVFVEGVCSAAVGQALVSIVVMVVIALVSVGLVV